MHYKFKLLIFTVFSMCANSAFAGAPFVTDDPEPVEVQHLEVNYAISKTWRDHGYSAGLPSIDFNYGYAPNLQLHVQPKLAFESEDGERSHGIDNLEIGAKYRFFNKELSGDKLMLGVYPMLQLPSGDTRLGGERGKTQLFLPLWGQYETGKWIYYGGLGYRFNNSSDDKNSWFFGATALYQLSSRMKIGGEMFRETATAIGEAGTSGFNLGGIYDINEAYHILFSAGQALTNISATNSLSVYMGLQVIY
jgi:hypothetical protein